MTARQHQGSGSRRVNIIVTCTKRKRVPPTSDLSLRHVVASSALNAFVDWRDRLSGSSETPVAARELYAGDHWSVVQTLERVAAASGFEATIWACSAGYGLIPLDRRIKSYSATFSTDHPDSVGRWHTAGSRRQSSETWWRLQTEWSGPEGSPPSSIGMIAANHPDSPLLVVASKIYLEAIGEDVRNAARKLCDPDLLCIVSAGTDRLPGLEANLLPRSAALQREVGGSLRSHNVRLARMILADSDDQDLRASRLSAKIRQRIMEARPITKFHRKRLEDNDVREYIALAMANDPKTTWSSLLRTLRSSGKACSQERFARLFMATKAEKAAD